MTPAGFAAFRVLLGLTLAVLFAGLLPFAGELFGARGLPAVLGATGAGRFPNALAWSDAAAWPAAFVATLLALALAFAAGVARRSVALALWYGWACLHARNPMLSDPSVPFVGWLCLACALVPPGEPRWPGGALRRGDWAFPPWLFGGAWIVLAVAYAVSGLDKLGSTLWVEGTALRHALDLPYARTGLARSAALALPGDALRGLTWSVLGVELLFAPLCLWRPARAAAWSAAAALHAGLLLLFAFPGLTAGMLLMHAFTFDARWWPRRGARAADREAAETPSPRPRPASP